MLASPQWVIYIELNLCFSKILPYLSKHKKIILIYFFDFYCIESGSITTKCIVLFFQKIIQSINYSESLIATIKCIIVFYPNLNYI